MIILARRNWFQDNKTAVMAVSSSWILFGSINVLLISVEIASVPDPLIEAVEIGGANSLETDSLIIIPSL